MVDAARKDRLERAAAFYHQHAFAINWTETFDGTPSKRCLAKEWQRTAPLTEQGDANLARGFFGARGHNRNPVVVARPSRLILIECDSQADIDRFLAFEPPTTLTVQSSTPDRRHFYFRPHTEGLRYSSFRFEGGVTGYRDAYLLCPPALHPSGVEYAFVRESGAAIAELPESVYQRLTEAAEADTARVETRQPGDKVPKGQRKNYLFKLAAALRARGVPEDGAWIAVSRANEENCEPPQDTDELRKDFEDVFRRYTAGTALPDGEGIPVDPEFEIGEPSSVGAYIPTRDEYGLAELFGRAYRDRLRYVLAAPGQPGYWIRYRGNRWREDRERKAVERAVERSNRNLPMLAGRLDTDDPRREPLLKYATAATKRHTVVSAVNAAESLPLLHVEASQLDQEPWLLACRNGTLDLTTGKLRDSDPDEFLTRGSPLAYDPAAVCPRWEKFLEEIFLGDLELVAYVQRLCGYFLTGSVREQALWIAWGATGGNGKTTFFSAFDHVLGPDLARAADFSSFVVKKGDTIPSDIARLHRTRLVTASEKTQVRALDEATLKRLTGGDRVTARFMYQDFFSFTPTFKIVLLVNEPPRINVTDGGIRRRVRMIPFLAEFKVGENADLDLGKKLQAEAAGILAWAVRGCLAYQRDGLGSCSKVAETTGQYLEMMNPLRDFFEDRARLNSAAQTAAGRLRDSYRDHCQQTGTKPLPDSQYAHALEAAGCKRIKTRQGMVWEGVELADAASQTLLVA